jgi:eukaryotic-like serine/threonine-protein kinase
VKEHTNVPGYLKGLAGSLIARGRVRQKDGDLVGASADWRRAATVLAELPDLDGQYILSFAGCHALLSSIAGRPGTGVSAGDREPEAEMAMTLLRRAIQMGCRDVDRYRTETALDPLRSRPDFRLLMLDLTFPAEPFAR